MKKVLRFLSPARLVGLLLNGLALVSPATAARIAFGLFGRPRNKKLKPVEAAFLATADTHMETINGRQFMVYHWGFRGPVVLLAHGWESHSGRWRKIAPMLVQAGYQVLAVDAPAHGRSQGRHFTMVRYADVLRTLLQRFGPIHTVIGHSVGGAASIWAMATAGPAVRPQKAVILCAFSTMLTVMDGAKRTVGASRRLMDAIDAYVLRKFGHPIEYFDLARAAAQLDQVEALLIHDRHDKVTAHKESVRIQEAWPKSLFWSTEGYGHGLTAPEVWDTMLEFVVEEVAIG